MRPKVLGRTCACAELPNVEHLSFSTPLMDDDGLAELKGLPRLRNSTSTDPA